ncbi:hypothetical protein AVEN_33335-1, partial [Araneus ventricosus]
TQISAKASLFRKYQISKADNSIPAILQPSAKAIKSGGYFPNNPIGCIEFSAANASLSVLVVVCDCSSPILQRRSVL